MTIEIRTLKPSDAFDDLAALSRAFFAEYASHHADFFEIDRLEDQAVMDYFNYMRKNGAVYIALDGTRMVGYITAYVKMQAEYWRVKRVGEISGLMVMASCRRQGAARRLLAAAQDYFRRKQVRFYTLYTAKENKPGLAFYERRGLTPLQIILLGDLENN